MALRLSTGLRNKMLGTNGFKPLMDLGVLDIYSGAIPTNADYAETGVLLCRISVGSAVIGSDGTGAGTAGTARLVFGTAANGVITKNSDTWSGTGINTGEAGYFRFYDTNLYLGTSATAVRMDGVCAVTGGDLNMDDLTVTASATKTITSFSITLPAY